MFGQKHKNGPDAAQFPSTASRQNRLQMTQTIHNPADKHTNKAGTRHLEM
jgi:hypothetical protein